MDSSIANDAGEEPRDQSRGLAHRCLVWLISTAGYLAIRAIGCTLRWQIEGWDHFQGVHDSGRRVIYAFWHGRILMGTYFWRNRGIVVMTSRSRDGDYIARVIRLLGYGVARGSSSRGSHRALAEMIRELCRNKDVAFAMDGPRGPRYVAKTGAAWLAAKTGNAVLPMHLTPRGKWVLSSWDHVHIPKPFTRTLLLLGEPIYVRQEATEQELEEAQKKIQQSLDDLRKRGDSYWGRHPVS
jgi:lysophospholipid acyltransferase (LPLAT)-like uncharacterized protein